VHRAPFALAAAALLLAGVCAPAAARAPAWHLEAELVTDFPVHIGGRFTLDMPFRLQISTALGELPEPFVDVINAVALAFDAYGSGTADLVAASLRDSLVWRLHVGWRPVEDLGLYVEVGYGLVTLGSSVRGRHIVTVLEDADRDQLTAAYPPFEDEMRVGRYEVFSSLHMLDAEVGWRWILESGWSFRVALGVAVTLSGKTDVTAASTILPKEIDAIVTEGTRLHLDTIYRKHVHTPVITFGFGHRLF